MTEHDETAAGIARLEGYLLWQGELSEARRAGEEFAARLPWLTREQHAEVAARYARERLRLAERSLRTIARRAEELRQEYTARYEQLRRRLLLSVVAALPLLLLATTIVASCVRAGASP